MLETEIEIENISPIKSKEERMENNLESLKLELIDLVEYRLATTSASKNWYRMGCMTNESEIACLCVDRGFESLNRMSQGILSELFFLKACKQNGIGCVVSTGDEDIFGVDFKIEDDIEARFLDVTVNISEKSFTSNLKDWNFPALFIPWRNGLSGMSTAEAYIKYGVFNGKNFLTRIYKYNLGIRDLLKEDIKNRDINSATRKNKRKIKYPDAGVVYLNNLEGVISLLGRSLSKN